MEAGPRSTQRMHRGRTEAPVRERDVAAWWRAGLFGARFTATSGETVRIVAPGMPGGGPGPDFRHAVLAVGETMVFGDVELHLRASGWASHRHQQDPAYDRVVLHVVVSDDVGAPVVQSGGKPVLTIVVALPDEFDRPGVEQAGLLAEPCRGALPSRPDIVRAALDEAGTQRIRTRAHELAGRIEVLGADGALWEALCAGMGYGGSEDICRSIAERWPWAAVRALVPAMGDEQVAGFFTAALGPRPLAGSRVPAAARMVGLARLAARLAVHGPAETLAQATSARPDGAPALLKLLQAGGGIGPDRARELAINAVLPGLLAWSGREGATALAAASLTAVATLPASSGDRITRHMDEKFGGAIAPLARLRQGAHHLYRGWCALGACGRCPLAASLTSQDDA